MDKRGYNRDMADRLYDMIELIDILNRLTKDSYDNGTKEYLLNMIGDMENVKYSIDKYKTRQQPMQYNYLNSPKKDGLIEKILFYLKSLNE